MCEGSISRRLLCHCSLDCYHFSWMTLTVGPELGFWRAILFYFKSIPFSFNEYLGIFLFLDNTYGDTTLENTSRPRPLQPKRCLWRLVHWTGWLTVPDAWLLLTTIMLMAAVCWEVRGSCWFLKDTVQRRWSDRSSSRILCCGKRILKSLVQWRCEGCLP